MNKSGEDSKDEVKPLIDFSVPRPRMPSLTDARSIEVHFNRSVRPSLVGKDGYSMTLTWENLKVSVNIPAKRSFTCKQISPPTELHILKGVSGTAQPGNLVAILGGSGCGKTTFLNVLTRRNVRGYNISGTFRLNGVEIGEGIQNVSAYVQQSDLFFPTLTVREHLQFRALLRMDKFLDREARIRRVEEVIQEMGLIKCSNNRIGTEGGNTKGISGGERKRLSFASEALTNPPIFFCDEPTSSLDSFMAQTIVQTLQKMARKGATILCTIRQPSSELFAMFNKVMLLSEGRLAFLGDPEEALSFFEKIQYPCPDNFNPADHYSLTLAIEPGNEEECKRKCNAICDAYAKSHATKDQLQQSVHLKKTADDFDRTIVKMVTNFAEADRYKPTFWIQTKMLFWRSWTSQFRNEILFRVNLMQAVVLALMIGLVYLDQDLDQTGVMNINGAIFVLLANITISNAFAVISSLPGEIDIVMRDYGTGLYKLYPYFFSKSLSEMPSVILFTTVYTIITYWMIGLNDSFDAFLQAVVVMIGISLIAAAFGYLISIVTGSTPLGLTIFTPLLLLMFLFSGLFLNNDDTPDYFIWMKYMSWFKYSFEILMVKQWKDVDHIDCDTNSTCLYRNGHDVLDFNSLDIDSVDEDAGALVVVFTIMYGLAFALLVIKGRIAKD